MHWAIGNGTKFDIFVFIFSKSDKYLRRVSLQYQYVLRCQHDGGYISKVREFEDEVRQEDCMKRMHAYLRGIASTREHQQVPTVRLARIPGTHAHDGATVNWEENTVICDGLQDATVNLARIIGTHSQDVATVH